MFMGMEFDPTMIMHWCHESYIARYRKSTAQRCRFSSQANADFQEKPRLILANPPFKGSLDNDSETKSSGNGRF